MWCLSFCVTSLSGRLSRSICVAANGIISFLMTKQYSIVCVCICIYIHHTVFIHSSVGAAPTLYTDTFINAHMFIHRVFRGPPASQVPGLTVGI